MHGIIFWLGRLVHPVCALLAPGAAGAGSLADSLGALVAIASYRNRRGCSLRFPAYSAVPSCSAAGLPRTRREGYFRMIGEEGYLSNGHFKPVFTG